LLETKLKRPILIFLISFALAIGLEFLKIAYLALTTPLLEGTLENFEDIFAIRTLLNFAILALGFFVFFIVFYFIAKKYKIFATKPIVTASLLGVIVGPAVFYLAGILLRSSTSLSVSSVFTAIAIIAEAGLLVFQLFFPALVALLLAELKELKLKNKIEENQTPSTTPNTLDQA